MPADWRVTAALLGAVLLPEFVSAQGVHGTIEGLVTNEQGLAVAGTSVTVAQPDTGLTRNALADDTGTFRISGLPVGSYAVSAAMPGAAPVAANVDVNVAATTIVSLRMPLALQSEAVIVTTAPPMADPRDAGVGEIATQVQVDSLPLNGRQFANLAALLPGVGLGFLVNIGKATQFAPQVVGGSGRNVNYVVDGGEHNDGRRGGLGQLFPLDSIEEFDLHARYRAEHGRASGAVLNVVTKSGRNALAGSAFANFRDRALNARSQSERDDGQAKADFRRYQFGASVGGPLKLDRAHFFACFERVHQDARRLVDTDGLFPDQEGPALLPLRESMLVMKLTGTVGHRHYAALRYAFNDNETLYPYDRRPPDSWTRIANTYHSANMNLSSVMGEGMLNELVAQYGTTDNPFSRTSDTPLELFPGGVVRGSDLDVRIEVRRFQLREDLSVTRGRHLLKGGLSFATEPVNRNTHAPARPLFSHLRDDPASGLNGVAIYDTLLPAAAESFPNRQYAVYVQDLFRVRSNLTIDLGLRYELVTGFAIDQSDNPLYQELQAAGRAGRLAGIAGLEDFGLDPREDRNNIAPRVGLVWDRDNAGTLLVRAGIGRYYDFPYTESTVGRFGIRGLEVLSYFQSAADGLRRPDGSLLRPGDALPTANLAPTFPANITMAGAVTPQVLQPFTDQANLGFSRVWGDDYVLELDATLARGRDLGIDPRLNPLVAPGRRRLSAVLPTMGAVDWRVAVSRARSRHAAVTLAAKKRWNGRLHFLASYTLAKATATSPRATDETYGYQVVDATDPFGPRQFGPTLTDARHQATLTAVWRPGWDMTLGSVFRARSATPYTVITGRDDNADGVNFDLPGEAPTVNQVRGSGFSQLDLRAAKRLGLGGGAALELVVEAFNLFNARNPADYEGDPRERLFRQPRVFAGDVIAGEARQGEQRQARFGVRVLFGARTRTMTP